VTFLIEEKDNALLVPASAVHRERRLTFVLIPGADTQSEPQKREVKLGISDGKKVEIVSGVNEGEKVLSAMVGSIARKEAGQKEGTPFNSPFGGGGGGMRH
jgi:HlyD family secretion protein